MTITFGQLRKNAKRDYAAFPLVRLALLGDSPTQFFASALRGYAYEASLDLDVFEADFDQVDRQILDPSSELHERSSQYVVVFEAVPKLYATFARQEPSRRAGFARNYIERVRGLVEQLASRKCHVIWCNFAGPASDVFGNFANKTEFSFTYQLRLINVELMRLAAEAKSMSICDISAIQNEMGRARMFSPTTYVTTGVVFELEAWVPIAKSVIDIVATLCGRVRKALILDLDNTVWGGVIGDDGVEGIQIGTLGGGRAFTDLQTWAKQLKERGVVLAVCSKNTESMAKEPFETHPEMVLRLEDIAVFVANWENKVDNIRYIQSVLNIGFDSMVFLDDNPVERGMVRSGIPELIVPELPSDPADYVPFLGALNLFETATFSEEDALRTQQYREDAGRVAFQKTFANEGEYLASLDMVSEVSGFTAFNTPRVAQLSQRSNQFNLRTVRYTDRDIEEIARDPRQTGLAFTLDDRFGAHGLICVVILKWEPLGAAFIDTWLMSCRVLKRGMEQFVLNAVVDFARAHGCSELVGEYVATPKNALVKDHYRHLGFAPAGERWVLPLGSFVPARVHIRNKDDND